MALFNEIQVGRFNAVLHKLMDMKAGAPAPQLSGDIFPVIALESDRPEYAFLGNEALCYSSALLSLSAGDYNQFQLWNPAGSGVLAVVEHMDVSVTANNTMGLYDHTVLMSGASITKLASVKRDYRWGIVTTALGFYYQQEIALVGTRRQVAYVGAYNPWQIGHPIILPPGYGVGFATTQVNQNSSSNVMWRERAIEPSELR